jgi:SAM-dependent methyltransferase
VWHYKRYNLQAPEAAILHRLQSDLGGKRVLDIGVGAGRTTPHLLTFAGSYVGIDIAPNMIAYCRHRFPNQKFAVCSATDLSRFANCTFDMVMFSFNGLDYVPHTARLLALSEIYRVLAPNGVFVFSSHNRAYRLNSPWNIWVRRPDLLRTLFSSLKALMLLPLSLTNHARMKSYEVHCEEFALLNDDAHSFRLLTYYISVEQQRLQLEHCGLDLVEAICGPDGHSVHDGVSVTDAWIYYVCRKPPVGLSTFHGPRDQELSTAK